MRRIHGFGAISSTYERSKCNSPDPVLLELRSCIGEPRGVYIVRDMVYKCLQCKHTRILSAVRLVHSIPCQMLGYDMVENEKKEIIRCDDLDDEIKKSRKRTVLRYVAESIDSSEECSKMTAGILYSPLEKTASWSEEQHTEDTFAHLYLALFFGLCFLPQRYLYAQMVNQELSVNNMFRGLTSL